MFSSATPVHHATSPGQSRACRAHTVKPPAGPLKVNRERGSAQLKAILWTVVMASLIYVGVRVVPLYFRDFTFKDGMQTIARFASATRQTPEQIRTAVLAEAQKDNVPITAKDIKIRAVNGNVQIEATYSIVVNLHLYRWTLNFHPSVSNNAL